MLVAYSYFFILFSIIFVSTLDLKKSGVFCFILINKSTPHIIAILPHIRVLDYYRINISSKILHSLKSHLKRYTVIYIYTQKKSADFFNRHSLLTFYLTDYYSVFCNNIIIYYITYFVK